MLKKILIVAVLLSVCVFATTERADATCSSGWTNIVYMYQINSQSSGQYTYVYVAPDSNVTQTFYYYFYTYNQYTMSALASAMSTRKEVYIIGSRSACGTGNARAGGQLLSVYYRQ